ncbi:hypothetical protein [Umezawaea tangerina]|uniref:Prolyl oligopeptidase family protein n=1 Tax=Umezawaea tangerina TaxID=84725 RepID=A0A2T0SXU0_9PSEU|nr:hypothetical protein [Umezawaea tangerina]PRY38234.1 hypothetical protein CLV43_109455 [Umezawaea tangerina]
MLRTRVVVSLLGLVLVAGGAPAVAAEPVGSADVEVAGRGVPDDQPLPGYSVVNPPLPPESVGGKPSRVLQGVYRHAAYTIEVPPNWNGRLTMWAHGYRGTGKVLTVDPPAYGLRTTLLQQGYAWAASSYYDNAYDVRAGVTGTHDLALRFGQLVGRPRKVFVAGVSMGGHVIGRSLEQYPGFYDGALPMCGVLGDQELMDFFLDFQLTSQALAGIDAYPPPADYVTAVVPRVQAALGLTGLVPGGPDTTNERGKQFRSIAVERSGGPRPADANAFAYWKDFLFGLGAPTTGDRLAENPGRIATNLTTRYSPTRPVDVNRAVERVAPEDWRSRVSPALTEIPRIAGRPTAPVLSLHGVGDMFVPFSMEQLYHRDVVRNGRGGQVVQRAIRTVEHCEFAPSEVGAAWTALVDWVDRGRRPAGDDVDAASAADFGCRFSDRAAYPTGTRGMFAPCA